MLSIVVLAGGASDERGISLQSGTAVTAALLAKGYRVVQLDPAGKSFNLADAARKYDVVFPALHGLGGEDGTLQRQLEQLGAKYVGSSSQASTLCFDKWRYTKLLEANAINVPASELVGQPEFEKSELSRQPFVLKPKDGGSSIDTFIVREPAKLQTAQISEAFGRHGRMLLQRLIAGTEITVGIIGDEPLPVIEIVPPIDQEFDYTNKYNGATRELCPPQHIDKSLQQTAQTLAVRIHKLTGCRDLSRTDMIINPTGDLYVLETNTIPGLTGQSLLPRAAAVAGCDMPALVDRLVKTAYER